MGWQKTTEKPEQFNINNNTRTARRERPHSVSITGREAERIIVQRQYSSTEFTSTVQRNGLERTQETVVKCTIVGQILRIVGDRLDSVKKDNYEITHYGRV